MNDELKTIRKEAVNTNQGTSLAHASSDWGKLPDASGLRSQNQQFPESIAAVFTA